MNININELKKFLEQLVNKAEICGLSQINIENDFYWNIPTEESFNFNIPDPKITVGSLVDDYNCLTNMLADDLSTPVDFERLAHLLLAFSFYINSSDTPYI